MDVSPSRQESLVEGSLRAALEPHKTSGQVDIMYTFQFVAPVQVQGRQRKVTKRLDVPYMEEVDVCVSGSGTDKVFEICGSWGLSG